MKKLKYIFKKLKTMQFKEFYNKAKEIGKKINKSTFYILFDMAKCAFKFGSGYMDYFEFEFYLMNDDERSTFLTGRYNTDIVKKYNKKEEWYKLDDKIVFNKLFKEFLGRDFLDLREVTFKEFKEFVINKDRIVVKPIDGSGGKGVEVIEIDRSKLKNEYNVLKIYNSIMKNEQFLVEEYIVQHKDISKLYNGSVNGIRVISFLDDDGEVHILSTILRIGNNGSVDNFCSGGMYTFVNSDGVVEVPAQDEAGNIFSKHPSSGVDIVGFKVPNYDMIEDFVKRLSLVVPDIRYVGWDIVVRDNDLIVIEGNPFPGVFQTKPSLSGVKTGDLVKYRKYMDI